MDLKEIGHDGLMERSNVTPMNPTIYLTYTEQNMKYEVMKEQVLTPPPPSKKPVCFNSTITKFKP